MSSSNSYEAIQSEPQEKAGTDFTDGGHVQAEEPEPSSRLLGGRLSRGSRYNTTGRWYTILVSLIALSATIGWTQTILYSSQHNQDLAAQSKVSLGGCGDTPEESLRQGCVFDLMMYNWVHPACYYKDLSEKFIEEGNWTFYSDAQGQAPIQDYDKIYRGEIKQVWLRGDFHHSHCAYILQKRLFAEDGHAVTLDVKTRSRAHTEHCIKWVSQPKPDVFGLATLNLTNESLDCVAGQLSLECQIGYDVC